MINLYQENGKFKIRLGSNIKNTIHEAIIISIAQKSPITFTFNEVDITVNQDSDPEYVYQKYQQQLK